MLHHLLSRRPQQTIRSIKNGSFPPMISTVRNYWSEVVQEYRKGDGTVVHEDPEKTYMRLRRASNAEGRTLYWDSKSMLVHFGPKLPSRMFPII